jgi:uncharacterized membrane protein YbhN (UPF0104 family)
MMSACVYLALLAVGVAAPASAAIVVLAVTVAGLTLPTGPGFVGTIQACFLVALTPYNVGAERAVSASFFYNLLITVPPLLLAGGFWLFIARLRSRHAPQAPRLDPS